jgi:UDP-glucose 4-epimerase
MGRYLVAGGCGFIGSHVVRRLLDTGAKDVRIVDNFSSGTLGHLKSARHDPRVTILDLDLKDRDATVEACRKVDHAFHFASNPDIAKAMKDPTIDFWEGTLLTQNLLEGLREHAVPRLTYASGSGVYGSASDQLPDESFGPLEPISPYGASKVACEAMISAYCHMFDLAASCFRFANVIGDHQTHGVIFDFVRKLRKDGQTLDVLGDGTQEKSYVWVEDIVDALMLATPTTAGKFETFNVSTGDYITVREIADFVCGEMNLTNVIVNYGQDTRGWRGDVPIVRFDDSKIRRLGWSNRLSTREAVIRAIQENIRETGPT